MKISPSRPSLYFRAASIGALLVLIVADIATNEQDLRTLAVAGERVSMAIAWIGGAR